MDVLVSGSGPAGWALASRCARLGLHTAIVAPHPRRPWRATYGVWHDELDFMPPNVAATMPMTMRAITTDLHRVSRPYVVLDNARLLDALASADVDVLTGRVTGAVRGPRGCTVYLADGRRIATAVAVDATGARRALSGGRARGSCAEQTAVGVIVPARLAEPVLGTDQAVFMDWSPVPGHHLGWPTFLYALPIGGNRVLLEETSLARRPGLAMDALFATLRARLGAHGVAARVMVDQERVSFPVDLPLPPRTHPGPAIAFGAAAGMVHPSTGYSHRRDVPAGSSGGRGYC